MLIEKQTIKNVGGQPPGRYSRKLNPQIRAEHEPQPVSAQPAGR